MMVLVASAIMLVAILVSFLVLIFFEMPLPGGPDYALDHPFRRVNLVGNSCFSNNPVRAAPVLTDAL